MFLVLIHIPTTLTHSAGVQSMPTPHMSSEYTSSLQAIKYKVLYLILRLHRRDWPQTSHDTLKGILGDLLLSVCMESDGAEGESENGGLAPGQRKTQSLTNFQKDPGDKGCIPVLSASSDSSHSLLSVLIPIGTTKSDKRLAKGCKL